MHLHGYVFRQLLLYVSPCSIIGCGVEPVAPGRLRPTVAEKPSDAPLPPDETHELNLAFLHERTISQTDVSSNFSVTATALLLGSIWTGSGQETGPIQSHSSQKAPEMNSRGFSSRRRQSYAHKNAASQSVLSFLVLIWTMYVCTCYRISHFSLSLNSHGCRYDFVTLSKCWLGFSGEVGHTRDRCCFPSFPSALIVLVCRSGLGLRTRGRLELTMASKTAPKLPKTPTRGRQAKTREPLTPSLTKALNNLNLRSVSPIKQVTKNGPYFPIETFLEHRVPIGQALRNNALFSGGDGGKSRTPSRPGSRAASHPGSRPGSPTKHSRSASRSRTKNVVTFCGVEQRLDIVQMDNLAKALSNSQKSAEEAAPKAPNGKGPKRTEPCSSVVRFLLSPILYLLRVDHPFHSAVATGQVYHATQSRGDSSRIQPVPHFQRKFPGARSATRCGCRNQSSLANPHLPPGPATRARPVP